MSCILSKNSAFLQRFILYDQSPLHAGLIPVTLAMCPQEQVVASMALIL